MIFKFYNELPIEARLIREKVFVEEQGFENEFDDIDHYCIHMVIFDCKEARGCARMYEDNQTMTLGRIAVLKESRHLHIGSEILNQLEGKAKALGFHKVALSAQVRAKNFYLKNGYQEMGEEYLDEYCPHINMIKNI